MFVNKMVKNIILDMGGVLIFYDPHAILRTTFNEADTALVQKVMFDSGLWKNLDLGTMHFPELAEEGCKHLPERLHEPLRDLLSRWWDEMPPFPEMPGFIQELKDNGYKVYLCSNAPDDIYGRFDAIPALKMMDGILASCDYGVIKPDARLYQALYKKFSLDPAECFFVDDMPQNIEGAAKTGMQGYCYMEKDLDKLKAAMREAGIRI